MLFPFELFTLLSNSPAPFIFILAKVQKSLKYMHYMVRVREFSHTHTSPFQRFKTPNFLNQSCSNATFQWINEPVRSTTLSPPTKWIARRVCSTDLRTISDKQSLYTPWTMEKPWLMRISQKLISFQRRLHYNNDNNFNWPFFGMCRHSSAGNCWRIANGLVQRQFFHKWKRK